MTSIYDARVAEMDASAATAGSEEAPLGSLQISAPSWGLAARAYERFLGMPVWVVLGVVWVGGAALLSSCALALYVVGSLVVGAMA
jgi:hypothetical protein